MESPSYPHQHQQQQQQQQSSNDSASSQLLRMRRIEAFTPPLPITHLLVSAGRLVMAFPSNFLHCTDTRRSDGRAMQRLELTKQNPDDRLHGLYLDPTGCHILASMQSGCVLYAFWSQHHDNIRILPVTKLKDHLLDSVAWNPIAELSPGGGGTGPILVGTSEGRIFEVSLAIADGGGGGGGGGGAKISGAKIAMGLLGGEDKKTHADQYCIELYTLSKSVTGLTLGLIQSADAPVVHHHGGMRDRPGRGGGGDRCFLLATTPVHLFEFKATLTLPPAPEAAASSPPHSAPLFAPALSKPGGPPFKSHPPDLGRSCLRLLRPANHGEHSVAWLSGLGCYCGFLDHSLPGFSTDKCLILPYEAKQVPISLEALAFHVVLLYADRLAVHSLINGLAVCKADSPCRGQLAYRGIAYDRVSGTMWAFTEVGVYMIEIADERSQAWRSYLQLGQHELALQCCPGRAERSQVYAVMAETFFADGKFVESASLFDKSDRPFEQTALKFLSAPNGDVDGLKMLLKCRLNADLAAGGSGGGGGSEAVLLIWLAELYLTKLGAWRDTGRQASQDYELESAEFHRFLAKEPIRGLLERLRHVIYQLMRSHADSVNMIYLACLLNDQDSIVLFYLENEEYAEALKTIDSHPRCPVLHERHAQQLVSKLPEKTVDSWINLGRRLDPKVLLPALLTAQDEQALRYLEFAVNTLKCDHKPLHNLLLHLYSKRHHSRLIAYIEQAVSRGGDPAGLPFDAKYALDLCTRCRLQRPRVLLHRLLGHYNEGVELALEFDTGLAKSLAKLPKEREEQRSLWLMIAKRVVTKPEDVPQAMELLEECSDLLTIEDILPFFPDFTTIDSFKDAICRSLDQYKEKMDALRQRMDKCTEYAASVRTRMTNNKQAYQPVGVNQLCVCNSPLLSDAFYVYPCGHCLHGECAKRAAWSVLGAGANPQDDCPLCGEAAIESIDRPL